MSDRKTDRIIKSTISVAVVIVLSKLLGFARDAIIAAFFGATYKTDAFFFASGMPGIPAISMSLSTVFLPQYVSKKMNSTLIESDYYASNMLNVGMLFAIMISSAAILLAPLIVKVFAPGFDEVTRNLSVHYTRIIMGTLFLVMAHYMLIAILNANKQFGMPQMSGLLLNLVYIVLILSGARAVGINILLAGAILGAIVQVGYLLFISRRVFSYKPVLVLDNDARALFRLMWPVLLGNAVIQIHEIVDQFVGSLMESGTISVLTYGLTLNNMVKAIIITAISSVYYPYVSESASNKDWKSLHTMLNKTISSLLAVLIPISIITAICCRDIVRIVYERGSFSAQSADRTATVLLCYAIGFLFSAVREISSKTLYAVNKTMVVTRNGAIAVLINVVLSLILARFIGVCGIALATSLAELVSSVLMLYTVKKTVPEFHLLLVSKNTAKTLLACVALTVIAFSLKQLMIGVHSLVVFFCITIISGAMYFGLLLLVKAEEAMYVSQLVRRVIKKRV